MGTEQVALSVVLRVVGGGAFLRRCLSRLVPQVHGRAMEVIVPYDATVSGIDQLTDEFPQVCFLEIDSAERGDLRADLARAHDLFDLRTAKGLGAARGQVLALLEDYGAPAPDWCDRIIEAHKLPHGVIGGAVENEGSGILNWAVYFIDFGRYQLPLREGPAGYLTDVNVSYKRAALDLVPETWAGSYNEVTVHWALRRHGVRLWRRPQIVVYQDRGQLSFPTLAVERFAWGRLFGRKRARELRLASRLMYVALSPAMPALLLMRLARKVLGGGRNRRRFFRALPHIAVLTTLWCLGELTAYLGGGEASR